jgi:dATP pyrophosphohydrolase
MPDVISTIVEVCVFRFRDSRPEYLLLRRAPDEKLYPGLWQVVTGSVETGETAVDAALRELREETGFTPRAFWSVPFVSSFYDTDRDALILVPFFAAQVSESAEPILSGEHANAEWLSLEAASGRLVWPGQRAGMETVHRCVLSGAECGLLTRIALVS